MPLKGHPDPVVGIVIELLSLAAENTERYASTIGLDSSNTACKKCPSQAYQMPDLESCGHRQKTKQLLVQGV
jgi:hypothetical protein